MYIYNNELQASAGTNVVHDPFRHAQLSLICFFPSIDFICEVMRYIRSSSNWRLKEDSIVFLGMECLWVINVEDHAANCRMAKIIIILIKTHARSGLSEIARRSWAGWLLTIPCSSYHLMLGWLLPLPPGGPNLSTNYQALHTTIENTAVFLCVQYSTPQTKNTYSGVHIIGQLKRNMSRGNSLSDKFEI